MRNAGDLELRSITEDEFDPWLRAVELAFGQEPHASEFARVRRLLDLDRALAVFDRARVVATGGAWSFAMSLPGADPAPCAGVTVIGVAHDWRRRGLLSRMMRRLLEDARDRREPFAALYASESPIYGRYGFGLAAPHASFAIDHPWTGLRHPAPVGAVRLVDAATATERFPVVLDAHRGLRGGQMGRDATWWDAWLGSDERDERDDYSPRFHALIDDRGYAVYRVKPHWDDQRPAGRLKVEELVATDPEAHAALWAFVFGVDLVRTYEAPWRPVDDPLPLLLANRGRLNASVGDGLWLRLVDVGAGLGARSYRVDDRLVLDVHDPFTGWNTGRWLLETSQGSVQCERTGAEPDLLLDVADVGALTLGGVSASQLRWAGRLDERTPGATVRADRLFAVELAPWNSFMF